MVIFNNSWNEILKEDFLTDSYKSLRKFLINEYKTKIIYPDKYNIFNAFHFTPIEKIKVIIIGQDPYHSPGAAMGLAFSVNKNFPLPPSLKNIYKEIENDLKISMKNKNGDLTSWARSGIFLLNEVLTVEKNKPYSHKNKGWEIFTDSVIKKISDFTKNNVFMLWGRGARSKKIFIDEKKHLILEASHPSPLSASNGFFGCKHFSKANEYLEKYHKNLIEWGNI